MLVMRETRAHRNPRTAQDRAEGSGRGRVRVVDYHRRYATGVTRPPFVHFMGLTLRYDYSRGYCVLLPAAGFGRALYCTRRE